MNTLFITLVKTLKDITKILIQELKIWFKKYRK